MSKEQGFGGGHVSLLKGSSVATLIAASILLAVWVTVIGANVWHWGDATATGVLVGSSAGLSGISLAIRRILTTAGRA